MAGVYSYSGAFLPGTLAKAEAVANEFNAVAAGFSILAIQGVDSGAANAYVVTTGGGKDGIYADGMIVEFKAANSNTTSSTIAVDSGPAVSLTSSGGQSLAGGEIIANTWYRAMYNSTYSAFTIIAPTSFVITSNTISSSAPTHLVGLTPAGGSSTACAPIDVTFAIDQSIVPTWTGSHIFTNTVAFNAAVTFAAGLSLMGVANTYTEVITGNSTLGQSFGLEINAGTNASDIALLINSQNGSTAYFEVRGGGSVIVGNPTGSGQGVGTINATGLYINGVAVSTVTSANPSATIGLSAVNGTALTFMTSDSAPALSQAIAPTWTGAHTFTPASAVVPITINAAVNTNAMVLQGNTNTSNAWVLEVFSKSGSGFSSGVVIKAGTTAADAALGVLNAGGSTAYFYVYGDGEIMFTPPTAATNQTTNFYQVGMMDLPLHSTNAPAFQDRGKWVEATNNVTIPANSSVAYPIGTTMMIYNSAAGSITIAVTTDTLTWLPSKTTGTRTLAVGSIATVYKNTATTWRIWGFGLT